jgi:sortase A
MTLGVLCVTAGAVCLLYAASVTLRGLAWQMSHSGLFGYEDPIPVAADAGARQPAVSSRGATPQAVPTARTSPRAVPSRSAPPQGEALGRLRVPQAGIDVVVAEGTDRRTLSLGPGHLEGSALPGEPDNCIIAGHRDGPFGRLHSISEGDLVEIADAGGLSRYRVTMTEVVDRHDTAPLASADAPLLTLVTCYPFNHVGPAPRRFVVRAELEQP